MILTEQNINLIKGLAKQIFLSKTNGTDISKIKVSHKHFTTTNKIISGRWFVNNTLRGFDFDINDGNSPTKSLRLLEQNPNKYKSTGVLSNFALAARQGKKIAWLIDKSIQSGFVGRVEDEEWIANNSPGLTTITPGPVPGTFKRTPVAQADQATQLPNEEDMADIAAIDEKELPEMRPEDIGSFIEHGQW